jgi:hypothetical protein
VSLIERVTSFFFPEQEAKRKSGQTPSLNPRYVTASIIPNEKKNSLKKR